MLWSDAPTADDCSGCDGDEPGRSFRHRVLLFEFDVGFCQARYEGFDVFVAEEERLLLDCLARKQVPGMELRDLVSAVDGETAAEYADRFGQNSVKKRSGYLLEVVRGETVDALRIGDRNYPRLDLSRPDTGETNERWRIKVNTDAV